MKKNSFLILDANCDGMLYTFQSIDKLKSQGLQDGEIDPEIIENKRKQNDNALLVTILGSVVVSVFLFSFIFYNEIIK